MHRFVHHAIADSTRRSYGAAVDRYKEFCVAHLPPYSIHPSALTPFIAAEWLASLATKRVLASATIKSYSSALSTWFVEGTLSDSLNPIESIVVQRTLKGIVRELRPAEVQAREAASAPVELTPALLAQVEQYARPPGCGNLELMLWAAANIGTYGLLRPSEFLGSHQHRDRALLPEQITFYAKPDSMLSMPLLPPGTHVDHCPFPDRFVIALGATKADQLGSNAPLPVAAAPAVRALWRWIHLRRDSMPAPGSRLFCLPSSAPLACSELLLAVQQWLSALGFVDPIVRGRTFRRGGASSLMAAGTPQVDVAAAGRWRSQAMPLVYSNAASMQSRAVEVSRQMAPH